MLGAADLCAAQMLSYFRERGDAFWRLVDQPTHETGASYFCEHGVLILGPLRLEGREAIEAFLINRTASKQDKREFTRHVTSNYQIIDLQPRQAVIRSILAVYSGAGDLPAVPALPTSMGDIEDVLVRESDGQWRFERRGGSPLFLGGSAGAWLKTESKAADLQPTSTATAQIN